MIKHIFSDMDGTLLNSGHKISDKTIQFVRESNIPFTLVSGRAPPTNGRTYQSIRIRFPTNWF